MTALPPAIAAEMPFRRVEVPVDGVRLSVVDDGPRDAPTILFLHGNPTWSFLWRTLLGPAKDAGFRVVAPDHAGFGASEKPEDPTYHRLDRHVENLVRVADALDVRDATVVLHDWGGPIGLGFAVRAPHRVRRLVLANTVGSAPKRARPLSPWHRFFTSRAGYRLAVSFDLLRRSAMRFGVTRPLSPTASAAYAWPLRERAGRVAAARLVALVPDGPDHPTSADLRRIHADFPKLAGKPALVLWADRDRVFPPSFAEGWRDRGLEIADVKHVSPTAGHFWQEDDPEPFLREILAFAGAK